MGNLAILRSAIPTAQVSDLTTGSITLPSARGAFVEGDFDSIASATGTGSSNVITFSSIPSTYRHLHIRFAVGATPNSGYFTLSCNSDTAGNYHYASVGAYSLSTVFNINAQATSENFMAPNNMGLRSSSNYRTVGYIDLYDYAQTSYNKWKSFAVRWGVNIGTQSEVGNGWSMWKNSGSAINTITFTASAGSFTTNTTFDLYGIQVP